MKKPILCLDFDGVIHSYSSGWKGASIIPDPPVEGALEFIIKAMNHFEVNILSSRSHQWMGKKAMKKWLYNYLYKEAIIYEECPSWLSCCIHCFADPWEEQVEWDIKRIVYKEIKWPVFKPASLISIDDRGFQFTGIWPNIQFLLEFKPWNKK